MWTSVSPCRPPTSADAHRAAAPTATRRASHAGGTVNAATHSTHATAHVLSSTAPRLAMAYSATTARRTFLLPRPDSRSPCAAVTALTQRAAHAASSAAPFSSTLSPCCSAAMFESGS